MANISSVRITSNVDEVKNALPEVLEKALMEIGIEAEAHAKEIITEKGAVDTGRLRNSITHALDGTKAVHIGTNVEYAPYIEAGTSKMKARPYLRPAVEDFKDEYKEILENNLKNG
ncbi:MAG: HK97 gp10 family phage protein [Oscillospiraceae bacterium]|nr:HK97 gp10 family phage protein [Oscillospiraceae bacterium]